MHDLNGGAVGVGYKPEHGEGVRGREIGSERLPVFLVMSLHSVCLGITFKSSSRPPGFVLIRTPHPPQDQSKVHRLLCLESMFLSMTLFDDANSRGHGGAQPPYVYFKSVT